jgi:hypothetical protein
MRMVSMNTCTASFVDSGEGRGGIGQENYQQRRFVPPQVVAPPEALSIAENTDTDQGQTTPSGIARPSDISPEVWRQFVTEIGQYPGSQANDQSTLRGIETVHMPEADVVLTMGEQAIENA